MVVRVALLQLGLRDGAVSDAAWAVLAWHCCPSRPRALPTGCTGPRPSTPQERELNPYLKDGGSGVPPEGQAAAAAPTAAARAAGVGDGGASWRLKALKRAQQQAEAEVRWKTLLRPAGGGLCAG